jgi:threonine dehydrogenase-like Zn-dependent dehydrogenase
VHVQRGLDVHVLDLSEGGPKPGLVADAGATFHAGAAADIGLEPDVVIECTGHGPLVFEVTRLAGPDAVICLAGIASGTRKVEAGFDELNKELVLGNTVVFGTVNASHRNFEQAAAALAKADGDWLARLITRRVPMAGFLDGLRKHEDDVKVVVDLAA